jgi:SynChlorMet cassette protein ScmC
MINRGDQLKSRKDLLEQGDGAYSLTLGDGLCWSIVGTSGTRAWLKKFAEILKLRQDTNATSPKIWILRNDSKWIWRKTSKNLPHFCSDNHSIGSEWHCRNYSIMRLWHRQHFPDVVCELAHPKDRVRDILMMWYSMHGIYYGLIEYGGFPVHAALIEKDGRGFLLIGSEGVGKSTCCGRLPKSWNVLADDSAVIVPGPRSTYCAHPFPTWSELVLGRKEAAWDIQRSVPLTAVIFLEQAEKDEIEPLGQGKSAVMMTESASYLCRRGWKRPDKLDEAALRKRLFENACGPAESVRSYILRVSLHGQFWEKLENLIQVVS